MEFFLKKKRPSHENERKIAPKAIVPEPPGSPMHTSGAGRQKRKRELIIGLSPCSGR